MPAQLGLEFIEAMERTVTAGDRDGADLYLATGIRYTVGAKAPVHGIDAVFAYTMEQAKLARWDGHTLIAAWPVQDALVVEVISHFTRVTDGVSISFPCVDIYRFADGKIVDWRVYADMSPFHP